MRNLWGIMKTFNTLPTDESFRKLTDGQIDLIIYSMEEDYKDHERARKGLSVEADYFDSSFEEEVWNKDIDEWDVLKEGHDADAIAKQIEEITKEEDLKNLYSKFDNLDDYNKFLEEGGKTTRETEVGDYIDKQIRLATEKAKALESTNKDGKKRFVDDRDNPDIEDKSDLGLVDLDRDLINKSISLFNQEDDEDDEYTIL